MFGYKLNALGDLKGRKGGDRNKRDTFFSCEKGWEVGRRKQVLERVLVFFLFFLRVCVYVFRSEGKGGLREMERPKG